MSVPSFASKCARNLGGRPAVSWTASCFIGCWLASAASFLWFWSIRDVFHSPSYPLAMKVFAHRGVVGRHADENSIEAIKHAVELHVDGIEVDIRRSRDDEAVIVHDADLRRIAGDVRQIADLTAHELQEITLRHGTHIALLEEMTANVPPPIELNLEVKDREALELLARKIRTTAGLRARTIISSFSQEVIEEARRELPDVRTILLLRSWPIRFKTFQEWVALNGIYAVCFESRGWTEQRVARMRSIGLVLVAWEPFASRTTKRRARRLMNLGLDIVIANRPQVYLMMRNESVGKPVG
jgi:glycerophosphoryl diester phosphodiesterase